MSQTNRLHSNLFLTLFLSAVLMLVLFLGMNWAAYSIPASAIQDNAVESQKILAREGLYPSGYFLFQRDNFTDGLMIRMSMMPTEGNTFRTSLLNPNYLPEDTVTTGATEETENIGRFYGRYWHGYQLPLRLSLLVGNIYLIRIINYILLTLMLALAFWAIRKADGWRIAVIFLICMMVIGFPIIPMCMQFSSNVYITLAAIIILTRFRNYFRKIERLVCAFFIIGGVTSFIDLLTAPLMTLCIPLALALYNRQNNTGIRPAIFCSISWGAGYGLIWASKWLVSTLVTGMNFLGDAAENATTRMSGEIPWDGKFETYMESYFLLVCTILYLIFLGICLLRAGSLSEMKRNSYLIILAFYPPIWCTVLHNHSMIHWWFVWRAFGGSLLCGLLYLLQFTHTYKKSKSLLTP